MSETGFRKATGDIMPATFGWQSFLSRWSRELIATRLAERVEPPSERSDWLGFDPATDAEIAVAEGKLGLTLPPSYRAFLKASNGWRRTTTFIGRIRPVQEIDWFHVENEHWVEVYAECGEEVEEKATDVEYYSYTGGFANHYRAKHMRRLIQISDVDDGVYLLNPEAMTPDGEWEAWFFANWVPGAERKPSFAHLMVSEYRCFARLEKVPESEGGLPDLPAFAADVPRVAAKRKRVARRQPEPLEQLIEQMGSAAGKQRDRAVRTFCGRLKGRNLSTRRPDLVKSLVELYQRSPDPGVRSACVSGLTEFAEDGKGPTPLFESLTDPDPFVALSGMWAWHYFPDRRALEPLCQFVDSRVNPLINETAMRILGKIGDERAVATLTRVLLDLGNPMEQSFGSAAMALAGCGDAGFEALVAASEHDDPRVRFAAVVGLDVSRDPRAETLLEARQSDVDQKVRGRAKVRMGGWLRRTAGEHWQKPE